MTHDEDRPLAARERAALEAWVVPGAPPGFADRVVAALQRPEAPAAPRRSGWIKWAVVGAAALGAFTLYRVQASGRAIGFGAATPTARQTVAIGQRAIAVVEPGARMSWTASGRMAGVAQTAGDVFYRVERGTGSRSFRVDTPHGSVTVTGTCFRVELNMKRPWRDVAAVGIGAALMVTVYEGSVLFAGADGSETKVTAGQAMAIGPGGAAPSVRDVGAEVVAPDMPPGPAEGASREELLSRDEVQRAEIASLRARVRQLESGGAAVAVVPGGRRPTHDASGRPWFDPGKADLVRFAAECRVRYDLPPVTGTEPATVGPRTAQEMGLTDEERSAVNRVLAEVHRYYVAELRKLYVEITGDSAQADELSPEAMESELRDKSPPGEAERANERIARERAGLQAPPSNLASLSAVERFMRIEASLGDRTERELSAVIGPGRARALREKKGGWGNRREMAGCPGAPERQQEVER